ncbi:hypothetical protein GGI20_004457 [Coemansia sp. BCRC 34301]|nr:hypothetical protein GGI20_004457 [Coemansia sp. BCRC 34301]
MSIASSLPAPAGAIQVFISPNPDGSPGVPGPDRVLTGFVVAASSALAAAEQIEVQYRGVEVVGGTLDDFDDIGALVPRKGVRALTKIYFDERLVLWRRELPSEDFGAGDFMRLPFAIALPRANYPAEIKTVCKPAPSQSFEIAYHVIGWIHPLTEELEPLRYICRVPFVPVIARQPSIVAQAPVTRTAYDDRGKECLITRVTLSQSDYVPGDQVVGGVYIECTKANRSIRKAECQLRQRIECRMRRTFSSAAETAAERSAASSRPQSSQKSADSDDADILWTRVVDLGPWRPLTLTTIGLGLAASAAAATPTTPGGLAAGGSSSTSLVGDLAGSDVNSSAARSLSKGVAIMSAPNRSCSANVHTDIPVTTPLVPGHFLSFSYELLVSVTVYSLTRGSQAVTTRTPLGGGNTLLESATSTNPFGGGAFTLPRNHRLLGAEPIPGGGSLSASAACFPPNALQPPGSILIDGREKAQLKGSRFSVGAFQGGGIGARQPSGCAVVPEDSALDTDTQRMSAVKGSDSNRASCGDDASGALLPNAVDLLRFRYDSTLALLPKIFIPAITATANADVSSSPDMAHPAIPIVDASNRSSWGCAADEEPASDASATVAAATAAEDRPGQIGNSSEYDLAGAVYAAAEKVLKDKEWERPTSLYVPGKSGGVGDYDAATNSRRSRALNVDVHASAGHLLFGASDADKIDEEDEEYEEASDLDVESAINQLAPTKRAPESRSSLGGSQDGGVNDFIHGIDFFGAEGANGPELTGMLSADPDKLVFGVSLTGEMVTDSPATGASALADVPERCERGERVASGSTACQPEDSPVLFKPSWATGHKQQQPISSILRRSISMPGGSVNVAAGSTLPTPQPDAYSPGSTVARSAFETGSKTLVRKHRKLKDDGMPMSPRSLISAVSSSSPLGSSSRVGMLKTIGHRFTSWFTKK